MKIELNQNTTLLFIFIGIAVILILLTLSALVVVLWRKNNKNVTEKEFRASLIKLRADITGEVAKVDKELRATKTKQMADNFAIEAKENNLSNQITSLVERDEKREKQLKGVLDIQEKLVEKYGELKPVETKPEFKKGDWIVICNFGEASAGRYKGEVLKLTQDFTKENGLEFESPNKDDDEDDVDGWNNAFYLGIKIRLATHEEIQSVNPVAEKPEPKKRTPVIHYVGRSNQKKSFCGVNVVGKQRTPLKSNVTCGLCKKIINK
ncbi:hypothetical protein UFOVP916_18 [uncultured Caudovirales phage]|uniref:Uncharacterized protein n=1 Tax=uncultured Caudovirales phage TaxID=2100421 RepID=A0A6J5PIZ7_9CAUD|nr:hypothetical protein UFOVP827_39 [uncultured Caudovirales phage]CAB4171443.1 hypothetical protein UFOVP916_18 [uncultured Caudovirales phage]CAB4177411.1 hypothetical protein UFOVP1001_42 [uncultured Caudovirales phage]CAB4199305.1 hypothetical protein UFOVP1338_34 [uncultured Caudovirales phage]CAB4213434.1 hypothetical protein UFOVP1447_29 [uncultured Caudovirales phage]